MLGMGGSTTMQPERASYLFFFDLAEITFLYEVLEPVVQLAKEP